jgi:hypothetical protein
VLVRAVVFGACIGMAGGAAFWRIAVRGDDRDPPAPIKDVS